MKQILIILTISIFGASSMYAQTSDLFSYNKKAVAQELSTLAELEELALATGEELSALQEKEAFELLGIDAAQIANSANAMFDPNDIHWESFAWGFCCFPIGCVVMLANDDTSNEELNSFLLGAGTSTACSCLSYIALAGLSGHLEMRLLPAFVFLLLAHIGVAQNARIKADFTVKQKVNNSLSLEIGTAYYSLDAQKLVYSFRFPKKEIVVCTDSATYRFQNDTIQDTSYATTLTERSVFHLLLNGDFKNFGLGQGLFTASKVEKHDSLVVTTWKSSNTKIFDGSILVSNHKNKLQAVVYLDAKGDVVSKQFYENYTTVDDLEMPTKIVFVVIEKGKEYYKTIEFSNIVLNETHNDHMYHYPAGH